VNRRALAPTLLCVSAACVADPAAAQAERSCFAEARLEPSRAVVGQQVLYRVRIFSVDAVDSVEWSYPPSFPHLRSETLPGDPQPLSAADLADDLRVRDERRALFAERAGAHRLRAPELRCTSRGGVVQIAQVPEIVLQVDAPPGSGRPEDFGGLVGPASLHVTVTPRELALGETLRVAVMVRGRGNLWSIGDLFADGAFGTAEVFGRRPQLVLERGRSLFLRRHFSFDVVPREAGVLNVPEVALAYYDPQTQGYHVARSEPVAVTVRAGGERADAPSPERAPTRPAAEPGAEPRRLAWLLVPLLLAAALVPLARRWRGLRADPIGAALAEVAQLEASGDRDQLAAALARALRAALAAHVDDARALVPEELMARRGLAPPVAAAAHLLASVERARFDPEGPPPNPVAVRRAISDLS
jgi:hypothetical protein